ncbi:LamG domain-containing protein [Candidatus Poribacteria bacterium]|nr:LamG domain-containing protein [Candidatus Poribacteria bacterium]
MSRPAAPAVIAEGALSPASDAEESWPTDRAGLVFLWATADGPAQTFDAAGVPRTDAALEPTPHGRVRYTRDGAMSLEGGSFHLPGVAEAILPMLKATDTVSLEAWIVPDIVDARLMTPIVASPRVYGLWQSGSEFWFSIGSAMGRGPRAAMAIGQHLVLTFHDETVRAYLNGSLAREWPPEHPPTANWTASPLVFGAAENAAGTWGPWRGTVEGVAVYNRALEADEIRANYAAYAARVASRPEPTTSAATGRLLAAPALPDPSQSPYKRAWAAFEYEAEQVHSGDVRPRRILVARYVWMDGEKLPAAHARPGDRHELLLEPYEANPQIHSERQFHLDDVDLEMPMFYDVGPLTEE